jgi:hypothetical protein
VDHAFLKACEESFVKSKPDAASQEIARTICECATQESRHQGASSSALKREAARMQKDPKAKIQDRHILDAFHWCMLQLNDADRQGE